LSSAFVFVIYISLKELLAYFLQIITLLFKDRIKKKEKREKRFGSKIEEEIIFNGRERNSGTTTNSCLVIPVNPM
jgi:hypothetical protein